MRAIAGVLMFLAVSAAITAPLFFLPVPSPEDVVSSRIRYPNEEAIAKKACGDRRLLHWWIADPRKDKAEMTVRCAGVVTAKTEVKF